jgi:hypothetical protein
VWKICVAGPSGPIRNPQSEIRNSRALAPLPIPLHNRPMLSDPANSEEHLQARKVNVSFSPDALIRVARGFSCIFWGIPLSLLLFSGALDIRLFAFVRMPAYVLGIFVAYIGTVFLQRAGPLSDMWTRRVRQLLFLLLAEIYLAPFVYWWRQMPQVPYFTANMLALVICTTWVLFVVNRLAGEVCKLLCDRTFLIETQVAGWLSVGFMLTPLAHALYTSIRAVLQPDGPSVFVFELPLWIYALALLPFTITMAVSWKIKERCLQVLKMSAKVPPIQSPATGP